MNTPNPEHTKALSQLVNASAFPTLIGFELTDITPGHARVLCTMQADKHWQPFQVVHGGVISSLIDTATFWSTYYAVDDEHAGLTSTDLKVNYLAPTTNEHLITTGRLIKMGKRTGLAEAEVHTQDGKLVAHGTSCVMVLPNLGLRKPFNLPPKFVADTK